jgi:hypothetical protein
MPAYLLDNHGRLAVAARSSLAINKHLSYASAVRAVGLATIIALSLLSPACGNGDRTQGIADAASGDRNGFTVNAGNGGLGDRYFAILERYNEALCTCLPDAVGCDPEGRAEEQKACLRSMINEHSAELGAALECEMTNLEARTECLADTACDEDASRACANLNQRDCEEPPVELQDSLLLACPAIFVCDDSSTIGLEDVCNGFDDCPDAEDEHGC